jgi:aminopeptidase N
MTMPAKLIGFLKKYKLLLIGAALLAALIMVLTVAGVQNDRYTIDAAYDEETHTLTVQQVIHLTNRTGETLEYLLFNLYPNAFLEEARAPVVKTEFHHAYPNGFSAGGAQVSSVLVNDRETAWALDGAQKTFLRVQLPFRLRSHGSVEVTLAYSVTLPNTRMRMGYSDKDVRLCNVFATLCVHDGDHFRTDAYSAVGDPFVSECADWDVTLRVPDAYVVAGAGLSQKQEGAWVFKGRDMRDFALVMSKDFHVAQREQDGVVIRSFAFTQEGAQETLDYAAQSLQVYSALYGPYPYPDFSVCAAQFYVGGMEYPALVMLDDSLYRSNDGMLEFVTAHEAAHQWWYAGVGSDQVNAPWQDEALAEYSTLLYYESVYGAQSFDSLYQSMVRPATENASLKGIGVDQSLDRFESTALYDALIYRKGAAMLHDLRVSMGNDAFIEALRKYYDENLYSIAAPANFLEALGDNADQALGWLKGAKP